jgi:putative ABC transport system permease protein
MLKNYLKIALRSVTKQKGYASVNIVGLAAGLACFVMILLFVQHELSYDRFHDGSEDIYRVIQRQPGNVYLSTDVFAVTPAALAGALAAEYPEVRAATPVMARNVLLGDSTATFLEEGIWASNEFFDVFTADFVYGSPVSALAEPQSLVLSRSLALKIFGETNPVGQTLTYQTDALYTVTGVIRDTPPNSSLRYSFIADFPQSEIAYEGVWNSNNTHTFFRLAEGVDASEFEAKLPSLVSKYGVHRGGSDVPAEERTRYFVQPLTEVHLHPGFNFDIAFTGDIKYVYLFSAIGLIILILAGVNYTNLAVARSMQRAREVGLRKAIGAHRGQLIGQFLSESVLMSSCALLLALGLVHILLPHFNQLIDRPIQLEYLGNEALLPGLFGLVVVVGLLSGSYPALFMASLRPMHVLSGKRDGSSRRLRLQRLLIVGQYAVSIALIAGSFVIYRQMQFIQEKELGYDRDYVVTIPARDEALRTSFENLQEGWLRNPRITAVTTSSNLPTNIQCRQAINGWEGSGSEETLPIYCNTVGYDFLDVFGMELAAGRSFSRGLASDANAASLINEAAARALGWTSEEAVGRQFMHNDAERRVIGVVKDFHMHSMHLVIQPLILLLNQEPNAVTYISAKVRSEELTETIASMQQTVEAVSTYPFEYQFLDERFDELYQAEQRLGATFRFFTILALLIASLGLFGLAAYSAGQRKKEVGIRKVLGANTTSLVALLSSDFLRLVGIAFIVGAPVAYFAMRTWLDDFAYSIELGPGVFILSGIAALLIALCSVSYQAIRAALTNPVDVIRYE